jgi:hypothetical protein
VKGREVPKGSVRGQETTRQVQVARWPQDQQLRLGGGARVVRFCCVHMRARRCMQGPPTLIPPCRFHLCTYPHHMHHACRWDARSPSQSPGAPSPEMPLLQLQADSCLALIAAGSSGRSSSRCVCCAVCWHTHISMLAGYACMRGAGVYRLLRRRQAVTARGTGCSLYMYSAGAHQPEGGGAVLPACLLVAGW